MTKLRWSQPGSRFYETGLDRGVLYLSDGTGVAWSGLVSVEEDFGGDSTSPVFFDGTKVRDAPSVGDFSATLTAITYPDEFLEYEGTEDLGNGLYVGDQEPKRFGISYRTLVGNDVSGEDHAYKIHIVYNLTASADGLSRDSLSESPSPANFSWRISSVPADAPGYRPTAHVIIDTRELSSDRVDGLENLLYGDSADNARLPSLAELIDMMTLWDPKEILPQSLTGLAQLSPTTQGSGDFTVTVVDGVYMTLPTHNLVETDVEGLYQLI